MWAGLTCEQEAVLLLAVIRESGCRLPRVPGDSKLASTGKFAETVSSLTLIEELRDDPKSS